MRREILVLMAMSVLLMSCGNMESQSEVVEKSLSLQSGGTLTIHNFNGFINIQGWDQDTVELKVTKVAKGKSLAEALESTKIEIQENNGNLSIETVTTRKNRLSFMSVFYELKVPNKLNIDVTTSNGYVALNSIEGNIKVRSSNGPLTLEKVSGPITAKTSNGYISVQLLEQRGDIDLHTSNGGITLHVPEEFKASVTASTSNGGIYSALPMEGNITKKSMSGDINGGGPQLDLKTSNGSINIEKN